MPVHLQMDMQYLHASNPASSLQSFQPSTSVIIPTTKNTTKIQFIEFTFSYGIQYSNNIQARKTMTKPLSADRWTGWGLRLQENYHETKIYDLFLF